MAGGNVSVVIVNFNTAEMTAECIASLLASECAPYEIIVVDNASSDGSAEKLSASFPELRLVANEENVGFTKANNQGFQVATGDVIWMLNPDTLVRPDTAGTLCRALLADPAVGIVAPRIVDGNGVLYPSCRRFPSLWWQLAHSLGVKFKWYKMLEWGYDSERTVDWASGASLMFRRETLAAVGGLDENFFMYCEEVDFCRRVAALGLRVKYLPSAEIVHYEGESCSKLKLFSTLQSKWSLYLYFTKYHGARSASTYAVSACVEMFLRSVKLFLGGQQSYLELKTLFLHTVYMFLTHRDPIALIRRPKKITVVHVVNNLLVGGAQQLILDICRHIDRERFHLAVISLEEGIEPIGEEIRRLGVEVLALNEPRRLFSLKRMRSLRSLLAGLRPDIIHSHLFEGNTYARLMGPLVGCRTFIVHEHSMYPQKNRLLGIGNRMERCLALFTAKIITVSDAVRRYAIAQSGTPREKFRTLLNGITVEPFIATERKLAKSDFCDPCKTLVITVGTLTQAKDHATLLRAAALVLRSDPSFHFLVVGDGPRRGALEELSAGLGLGGAVSFVGGRRDVAELLKVADLFALTSVREGQGISLVEALVSGVPVVATDVGGIPEMINDSNGLLVPPGDPQATASAILRVAGMLREGALDRRTIQGEAQALFSMERYIGELQQIYLAALAADGLPVQAKLGVSEVLALSMVGFVASFAF